MDNSGDIWGYDGTDWTDLNLGIKAYDIAISNEGAIFFTDNQNNIWRVINATTASVVNLCGSGVAIAAGPMSQPVIVDPNQYVNTSSKMLYN